jgi:hypothetical protein
MAAFAALLLLALGAGSAAASNGVNLEGRLTGVSARSTALTFTDEESTFRIVCEVTLTMDLQREIRKEVGALVGNVTNVTVANCRGGTVRVLAPEAGRPWRATYVSFTGTLPSITSVRLELRGTGFLVEAFFGAAQCLYGGNAQGTTVGNPVSEIRAEERVGIPLVTRLGGIACPARGVFRGTFALSARPTMRLV